MVLIDSRPRCSLCTHRALALVFFHGVPAHLVQTYCFRHLLTDTSREAVVNGKLIVSMLRKNWWACVNTDVTEYAPDTYSASAVITQLRDYERCYNCADRELDHVNGQCLFGSTQWSSCFVPLDA